MDSNESKNSKDSEMLNISAVTIKLPTFWSEEPLLWFSQAESQFALRSIVSEVTKYHHVIAALDQSTAKRVVDVINLPASESKYMKLKERLLSTFTLSPYRRARKILNASPLGDRSPSELMDEMLALQDDHGSCTLFKTVFVDRMPPDVRTHLIPQMGKMSARELALLADQLIAGQSTDIHAVAFDSRNMSSRRGTWCRFHQRFGPKAYQCEQPCSFVKKGLKPKAPRFGVNAVSGNEEDDHL